MLYGNNIYVCLLHVIVAQSGGGVEKPVRADRA